MCGSTTDGSTDRLNDPPVPNPPCASQVIFLSSVGVLRTKQLPFNILNLCGVLDAKRDSEELLKSLGALASLSQCPCLSITTYKITLSFL